MLDQDSPLMLAIRVISFTIMILCAVASVCAVYYGQQWMGAFYALAWSYIFGCIFSSTFWYGGDDEE